MKRRSASFQDTSAQLWLRQETTKAPLATLTKVFSVLVISRLLQPFWSVVSPVQVPKIVIYMSSEKKKMQYFVTQIYTSFPVLCASIVPFFLRCRFCDANSHEFSFSLCVFSSFLRVTVLETWWITDGCRGLSHPGTPSIRLICQHSLRTRPSGSHPPTTRLNLQLQTSFVFFLSFHFFQNFDRRFGKLLFLFFKCFLSPLLLSCLSLLLDFLKTLHSFNLFHHTLCQVSFYSAFTFLSFRLTLALINFLCCRKVFQV